MEAEEEQGAGTSERTRVGCHLASPAIDRLLSREGTSGSQIEGPEEHPDRAEQTTCKKCGERECVIIEVTTFGVSVRYKSAFLFPIRMGTVSYWSTFLWEKLGTV